MIDTATDGSPAAAASPADVLVIDTAAAASAVLAPMRGRVLRSLAEPGSASTVAKALGESRQRVNYHLRALEEHGLVRLVEERPRRGLTERVMVATASSFVMSPRVLGAMGADVRTTSRLSSRYLLAVAGRLIDEVGRLARSAEAAEQPLATLTIDTEIRFASAAGRSAFTEELAQAVTDLAARYHDEASAAGRWHRLIVAAHPRPEADSDQADSDQADSDKQGAHG